MADAADCRAPAGTGAAVDQPDTAWWLSGSQPVGPQFAAPTDAYGAAPQPWSPAPAGAPGYAPPNPHGAPNYGTAAYGGPVTGAPTYTVPPVGAPMYAPMPVKAPTNGWAVAAFVVSLVMLAVGVFSGFYIGSLLVLLMARQGLRQAKTLESSGFGPRGRALAWWGMGVGILNVVIVLILKIAAI